LRTFSKSVINEDQPAGGKFFCAKRIFNVEDKFEWNRGKMILVSKNFFEIFLYTKFQKENNVQGSISNKQEIPNLKFQIPNKAQWKETIN